MAKNTNNIPQWHETDYRAQDVVSLLQIELMERAPNYTSLRNYATYRRESKRFGVMPHPACRIANRKLWLKTDIEYWLRDRSVDIFGTKTRQRKAKGYTAKVKPRRFKIE